MRAKKSFGQNFLVNAGVIEKIIAAVDPQPTDQILEIGPGPGALTRRLAASGATIVAVDADRDMIGQLHDEFADTANVTIIHNDILQYAWDDFLEHNSIKVVGNIPYNISSPILFWLADHRARIAYATLTIQREVALRLTAEPNTKAYGALTIGIQSVAQIQRLFDIQPGSFRPAPKVTSSTIQLTFPNPPPYAIDNPQALRDTVRMAFSKRRKMLRNSFEVERLEAAGIDPTRRPETLSIDEFIKLSQ
jgi:16S rRNA (adenine1518-N6/adenine1519-N6)-dimethyltransferase